MSIICTKRYVVLFTSNMSRYKDVTLNVSIAENPIAQVREVKYLGLYIDSHLSFDPHIHRLCNEICVRTKLLWRIRLFITRELASTLYRASIEPHLHYCSFILEGTAQGNLTKQVTPSF